MNDCVTVVGLRRTQVRWHSWHELAKELTWKWTIVSEMRAEIAKFIDLYYY